MASFSSGNTQIGNCFGNPNTDRICVLVTKIDTWLSQLCLHIHIFSWGVIITSFDILWSMYILYRLYRCILAFQGSYYHHHFVGHCGAFCGLERRIWQAKISFSPLSDCSDCFVSCFWPFSEIILTLASAGGVNKSDLGPKHICVREHKLYCFNIRLLI